MYTQGGPFFWPTMGMTSAVAMFTGAIIYDGDLNQVKKGLLSVGSYALLLFWMILARVQDALNNSLVDTNHPERALAGMISIVAITLAWLLGIELGVLVFNRKYKGKHA
jgi:hypothetical protein